MLEGLGTLLGLLISFCFGMFIACFALVFMFSVFQGISRTIRWHIHLTGRRLTILRIPTLLMIYLTVIYNIRHAKIGKPSLLIDHHGYRMMGVVVDAKYRKEGMAVYINKYGPSLIDHFRTIEVSNALLKLPNWGKPDDAYWAGVKGTANTKHIIMAITDVNEIHRWGIVPMVVALSLLTLDPYPPQKYLKVRK